MIRRLSNLSKIFFTGNHGQAHRPYISMIKTQHLSEKQNLMNVPNTKINIKLGKIQQQALTAYFAFLYIVSFKPDNYLNDPRSIQQRLISKESFNTFIINQTRKYYHIDNIKQLGLEEANINTVLCAFNLHSGGQYSQMFRKLGVIKIFRKSLKNKQKIIEDYGIVIEKENTGTYLFPTLLTGQIFRKILEGQNLLVSSAKSTGKSHSLLLYQYLSRFILDYKIGQSKSLQAEPFRSLLQDSYFYKIRKMFYLQSINRHIQYSKVFDIFSCLYQSKGPNNFNKLRMKTPSNQCMGSYQYKYHFKQNAIQIVEEYRKKGIQSTIVLDEYNHQFGDLLQRIRLIKKGKQNQIQSTRLWRSEVLKIIQNFWTQLILISEDHKVPTLIQRQANKFGQFNFYDYQKPTTQSVTFDHTKLTLHPSGQLENYAFFWFKLEQFLIQKQINLQERNYVRLLFEEVFCLPNSEGNVQNKTLLEWNHYINFANFGLIKEQNEIILKEYIKCDKKIEIKGLLLYLKQRCQNYRYGYGQREIRLYLSTTTSDLDKHIRFSILIYIQQHAIDIIKKSKPEDIKRNCFIVSLKDIDKYLQIDKEDTDRLQQHLNVVAQQTPFGFYDAENKLMIIYSQPQYFIKVLQKAYQGYQSVVKLQVLSKHKRLKQQVRQRIQEHRQYLTEFIRFIFFSNYLTLQLTLFEINLSSSNYMKKQFRSKNVYFINEQYNNLNSIVNIARENMVSYYYTAVIPSNQFNNYYDMLLIRYYNYGNSIQINTFSWFKHQFNQEILVNQDSPISEFNANSERLTSLSEIDQLIRKNLGEQNHQHIIRNRSFLKHQFYSFIKMMLQSTQLEGIIWRHIITLPKSEGLRAKYSKDDRDRIWEGDKLLFEGSPQWSQNGRQMKFSCIIAQIDISTDNIYFQNRPDFLASLLTKLINKNAQTERFYDIHSPWFIKAQSKQKK